MTHIPDDVLSAWLEDELTEDERARAEGHLETCERCRRELAALRDVVRHAREAPPEWTGKTASWVALKPRLEGQRTAGARTNSKTQANRSGQRGPSAWWGMSVAGLAVAALAAVLFLPGSESETAAFEALLAADRQVAQEVEVLLLRNQAEAPEVRQAIAEGNRQIDEGMEALQQALRKRPEDPVLTELARRATSHRMNLLREVTR